MKQNWYKPHPYGVYPRGNATNSDQIMNRFGTLSRLFQIGSSNEQDDTELPFLELMQLLMSFIDVEGLCRLSRACTGWYVMVHCSDAFKTAYTSLFSNYLCYRGSWKETAIRGYLRHNRKDLVGRSDESLSSQQRHLVDTCMSRCSSTENLVKAHRPVLLSRSYFCDNFFQAWMCTLLPPTYHLCPIASSSTIDQRVSGCQNEIQGEADSIFSLDSSSSTQQYSSRFKPVERCSKISRDEFRQRFEERNVPVVITDIATEWPFFKILARDFKNLSVQKKLLMRSGCPVDIPFRCEHTNMSLDDYVRYATEQTDERPIYLFDPEFGDALDLERLYTVPAHFARDDFFSTLGPERRPKHRWLIAGPARGGSSFHVDPNYTSAWNANLTGRKRWLLFPPGVPPPGVMPSPDMAEVATPLSLTEWLLNYYDAAEVQLRGVGYECICEPGEIMFIPSGWWHYVINLEDSVAITQNYVSECNLPSVIKFLRHMKGSISGIDEDAEGTSEAAIQKRRERFADEFVAAMHRCHPAVIQRVEDQLNEEQEHRKRKRMHRVDLLEGSSDGFKFNF
ncbi:unnamed protein product [Phytomonas sp. EM1]|nr:unnamed protein product [Phytomonas sp. EM1]|eukprot:CCW60951.1 unnamed protein product [Phytomonas sp. isolate EM1]